MKKVAVIGGGAAGMMAAITAAESAQVTLFEKNERVGKKILATGNGKCNFSNQILSKNCYYGMERDRIDSFFREFSNEDTVSFFQKEGMLIRDKSGYLYPWSEQASTVLDTLRLALTDRAVRLLTETDVTAISRQKAGAVSVITNKGEYQFDAIIIACGGCAAPKTGSDGSGLRLAKTLGHTIIDPVPALVQLRCSDPFFKTAAGVRCEASLVLMADKEEMQSERGELQFTDYGISGIPVFQLSRSAAYLLKSKKKVCVRIDLFPDFDQDFNSNDSNITYDEFCDMRMKQSGKRSLEEFLNGMANKKLNLILMKQAGLSPADSVKKIERKRLNELLHSYRHLLVHVTAVNSFENAQVSAGGVNMKEITNTMESAIMPGIFFAGEVVDIDGRCGGYNLQWAWTSGYIAGKNAAAGRI